MPIAVVTGASSGIGAAICRKLLSSTTEKWKVIMIARTKSKMDAIATNNEQNVLIIPCDVSIPENIIKTCIPAIQKWLKSGNTEFIDVLINNIGGISAPNTNTTLECELAEWNQTMHLNLTSMWLFTKYLLPYINNSSNTKYKSIVNIGSISGSRAGDARLTYHVAKAAVDQFTKCAALHCAKKYKNIRVNCVAPGWIETGIHARLGKDTVDEFRNLFVAMTPMGKVGTKDDMVNATEFLMNSEKSGWITGEIIRMDGGMSLPQVQSVPAQSKL